MDCPYITGGAGGGVNHGDFCKKRYTAWMRRGRGEEGVCDMGMIL